MLRQVHSQRGSALLEIIVGMMVMAIVFVGIGSVMLVAQRDWLDWGAVTAAGTKYPLHAEFAAQLQSDSEAYVPCNPKSGSTFAFCVPANALACPAVTYTSSGSGPSGIAVVRIQRSSQCQVVSQVAVLRSLSSAPAFALQNCTATASATTGYLRVVGIQDGSGASSVVVFFRGPADPPNQKGGC